MVKQNSCRQCLCQTQRNAHTEIKQNIANLCHVEQVPRIVKTCFQRCTVSTNLGRTSARSTSSDTENTCFTRHLCSQRVWADPSTSSCCTRCGLLHTLRRKLFPTRSLLIENTRLGSSNTVVSVGRKKSPLGRSTKKLLPMLELPACVDAAGVP